MDKNEWVVAGQGKVEPSLMAGSTMLSASGWVRKGPATTANCLPSTIET